MVLTSFLSGYLAATVFDFASLSRWVTNNLLTKHAKQQIASPVAKKEKEPELPKPKFEFYTLLAKDRVPVAPSTPAKVITTQPETPVQAVESKEYYYVQIASFRNRQDAEHLKAELTLKGYDVNVTSTIQQQVSWYRVSVGPFKSRIDAEKIQLALAEHERIKGMLRKLA